MDSAPLLEGEDMPVMNRFPESLGQSMTTKADFDKYHMENLKGIIHGFDFPFNCEQILEYGPAWLTKALRASHALTDDTSVVEITNLVDISKKVGGGAADKAILEVKYSGATDCPTKFFLKLPCKKVADRIQAASLNAGGPEVAFAHFFTCPYSKTHKFPMEAAKMYFCDINVESSNFIQIQDCLPFSESCPPPEVPGALWPAAEKFQDWKLDSNDTAQMYNLLMEAMGKQAAWMHNIKQTELGQNVQKFFPADLKLTSFPQSGHFLLRYFIYWIGRSLMFFSLNFIQNKCPQLCPEGMLDNDSLSKFQTEFLECLYYFPELMCHNGSQSKKDGHVLWCHPNLNLDNAYFYRGADGKEMNVGGLDFGQYGGHLVTLVLSGSISGADNSYYMPQREHLIKKFCSVYSAESGQHLDGDEVFRDFELLSTMKSLICCAVCLKVFETMDEKELRDCKSEKDSPMVDDFYGRCFTLMTIGSFERWSKGNQYGVFKKWAAENNIEAGTCGTIAGYIFYWPWGPLHTVFMKIQVFLYNHNLLKATWGAGFLALFGWLLFKLASYFM